MTSSLAPYFLPVAIEGGYSGADATAQAACQKSNPAELQTQTELAKQQLQRGMMELKSRMIGDKPLHLAVVAALFGRPAAQHAIHVVNQCTVDPARGGVGRDSRSGACGLGRHPWSSDQSAFRFPRGYLLQAGVMASTATRQTSRLWGYHAELLRRAIMRIAEIASLRRGYPRLWGRGAA
ncbi:hypothetical protein DL768_005406 [Monosporascus sp. mg162]|nr:hypothetical protein DL768_005406 [Monosporascus sp. mg162]